jgi:hypothetical protein
MSSTHIIKHVTYIDFPTSEDTQKRERNMEEGVRERERNMEEGVEEGSVVWMLQPSSSCDGRLP